MRHVLVLDGLLSAIAPVAAAECTLNNARYVQTTSQWSLNFRPIPEDAPSNMTASFVFDLPLSKAKIAGGVYQPNGFSSSLGSLEETACTPSDDQDADRCPIWSGQTFYALGTSGIEVLANERDAIAPKQIVLPGLASDFWYSNYRSAEFVDTENEPGDIFTLEGCAS